MSKIEQIKSRFSKTVENEVEEWNVVPSDEIPASIAIIVLVGLLVFYFAAHQIISTGFFTATFGTLEMIMLYGSLSAWIVTGALMLFGRKANSRDFDAFGGLVFATVGIVWVFVVYPFDFALFANVLPDFLRFLVQWITNDIARGLMVFSIIGNLAFAVYSLILRVAVRKALERSK